MTDAGTNTARRDFLCALGALGLLPSMARAQSVPFVGSPPPVVDAMLDMAKIRPDDYVMDLGCGDGRLIIAAVRRYGAQGMGVDLDAALVQEAQRQAVLAGVEQRARFEVANLYQTDISRASVLTLYLFPSVNLDLRPRILRETRPGTRLVSHEFDFGNWPPDEQRTVSVPNKRYGPPRSTVLLWIVPANASGRWTWQDGAAGEAVFDQKFQILEPRVPAGARYRIENARLRGDEIGFAVAAGGERRLYAGRINGDRISGTVTDRNNSSAPWSATRVTRGTMDIEAPAVAP